MSRRLGEGTPTTSPRTIEIKRERSSHRGKPKEAAFVARIGLLAACLDMLPDSSPRLTGAIGSHFVVESSSIETRGGGPSFGSILPATASLSPSGDFVFFLSLVLQQDRAEASLAGNVVIATLLLCAAGVQVQSVSGSLRPSMSFLAHVASDGPRPGAPLQRWHRQIFRCSS